uniref:Toll-like receptor 7 n=1 Tax=Otus sunia TaxID=257818 RepID=A0A8C8ATA5_9STRI
LSLVTAYVSGTSTRMLVLRLSVMIKLFFQLDASICPEKCDCSSKNAIHYFVFSNLTNLELLVLSFNPELSVLPKNVFSGLNELRGLSLHTNNISSLPEGIFLSLQKLQNISLFDKRLEVLPRNLFHNLKHLQKVYLNSTKLMEIVKNVLSLVLHRNTTLLCPMLPAMFGLLIEKTNDIFWRRCWKRPFKNGGGGRMVWCKCLSFCFLSSAPFQDMAGGGGTI